MSVLCLPPTASPPPWAHDADVDGACAWQGPRANELTGEYFSLADLPARIADLLRGRLWGWAMDRPAPKSETQLAGAAREWPTNRGVWVAKAQDAVLAINGEDHVSLVTAAEGGDVQRAFERACTVIKALEKALKARPCIFRVELSHGRAGT